MNTLISIPGYEFQQKIEESSTSTVWKARQESLARYVAIKILKPELVAHEDEVQAFLREARAVAKLKSPKIIQVYDVGQQEQTPYIVMECVDGHPLSTMLDLGHPMPQKRALTIALSVAQALSDAWNAEKLIHRNIKPANIMLEKGGGVKVANLGMSGRTDNDAGYIVGTPSYMSPEQAQASDSLTIASDMYSLGAVLYHMVTGRMPFADLDEDATLEAQIEGKLPFPQDVNSRITPPCAQLIARLMMKDPRQRYPDWQSAINDIAKLASGKMLVLKPLAGSGSTIAAKGASKLKAIKKKPPTKKVLTTLPKRRQKITPVVKASIPAAGSATVSAAADAAAAEEAAEAAAAKAMAARAAALKKKYSKPTTPIWIKLPLAAALMALFGWLGFSLLWQPFREAYPRVAVADPVISQPEPLPLAAPPTQEPQPYVAEPTTSSDPSDYVAEAEPPSQPEPPQNTMTREQEPELPRLDGIKRSLVNTALSEGLDAAANALRRQQGGNGELNGLSGFFSPANKPENIIAENFKALIGQETYVNMGGRRIEFRVEGVNGETVSTMVKSKSGNSVVFRPAELQISQLPLDEQRRWMGELETPEKAFAAAMLDLSTANYADIINRADACGQLAAATRDFAQRRVDMLLE